MPYVKMNNERYVGLVVGENLKKRWQLIRKADRQGLLQAFKQMPEIDLCHYDSDKTYSGRMWAYPLLWNALKPGGILVSNDIEDNTAFKDFAVKIGKVPIIVKEKHNDRFVGILKKEL